VVNLANKFARFTDRWSPKIVGEVNDMTSCSSSSAAVCSCSFETATGRSALAS
jgi:hypothetical protein